MNYDKRQTYRMEKYVSLAYYCADAFLLCWTPTNITIATKSLLNIILNYAQIFSFTLISQQIECHNLNQNS